ncbi:inositol polyphosphate 1-phosphatase [Episyrphus balteatus]|uniref:inositol polyphosphate 1-phosphatase n=1 Tax=Episyrphus balteatus TaxID=286459 RepID=UPI00248644AD|nr:inositol polyphosphate 1-phosphatase [Episyrphus balteatus]XP_055851091.1 inositol polyphosphate 1-phosphatase [Episyrphus balteatus]XP_055851092.1 inositol polyphosphate 1-phosphatase [Episyrphus balteatus]
MSKNLLKSLINVTERAANIARACRANADLLALLIQEKSSDEANPRFVHDFKTLADVLIQETVRHYIGNEFPEMKDHIKGEESSSFTNKIGETVTVEIGETPTETADCLEKVLDGNRSAADVLAEEVHRFVNYADQVGDLPDLPDDLDYNDIGIWIDPIDATSEYISGDSIFTNFPGITSTGLDCVTVLIGGYSISSGQPMIGVVSQPFHNKIDENVYKSLLFWGVSLESMEAHNCPEDITLRPNNLGIFSTSENSELLQKCMALGYEFAFSAGAGHKALKVITGEVDLYLLSKGSTFKWDTCAPQAILKSLGGNIFDYRKSLEAKAPIPVSYLDEEEKCNAGGLIAVRNMELIEPLLEHLRQ